MTAFQWSGANSHRARFRAAEEFRTFLQDLFAKHPDGRHVLIGHSHGGNVILYAYGRSRRPSGWPGRRRSHALSFTASSAASLDVVFGTLGNLLMWAWVVGLAA